MSAGNPRSRWLVLGSSGAIIFVSLLLQWWFSGRGHTAPDFALFVGRLHPLIVHLPIGTLILVACLEVATFHPRFASPVDATLDLIQPLAVATCFLSFLFGHLLGWEGGFSEERLSDHRQLALLTVICCCVQFAVWRQARARQTTGARMAYRAVLTVSLLSLSGAAHVGGTLSRGEGYLARYAPEFLKPMLGGKAEHETVPPATPEPGSEAMLFAHAVQPMLLKYCAECHGPEKTKGGLRVDSLASLLKGGESGPSVVPGNAEASHLLARSELPATDEDFMPPEGNPAPSPGEVALLRFWISRGARADQALRDALPPALARGALEHALSRAAVPTSSGTVAAIGSGSKKESRSSSASPTDGDPPRADSELDGTERDLAKESPAESTEKPGNEAAGSAFSILQNKCGDCHGSQKQKSGFRVDSVAALFNGGKSGPGIVEGNSAGGSLLSALALPLEAKGHMPPKNKPQLTSAELQRVRAWVAVQSRAAAPPPSPPPSPVEPRPVPSAGASPAGFVGASDNKSQASSAVSLGPSAPSNELLSDLCATPKSASPGQVLVFQEVIHPLLKDKCASCHEADLSSGGLSVQSCETLFRGGDSGPVIVAGDSGASLLVSRLLLALADDEHMPPRDYPQLSEQEIDSIREWIDRGARRDATIALSRVPEKVGEARHASAQAELGEEATQPAAERGGCAACTMSQSTPFRDAVYWFSAMILLGLAGRRRFTTRRAPAGT